jgi:SAM-dependent methyltransferase
LEVVRSHAPGVIVEAGCADGMMTAELAQIARDVWAFDISREMVRRCPQLPNVYYAVADIETVPFAGHADMIVCCEVLEHVEHPRGVIERMVRAADRVLCTCPVTEPLNEDAFDLGLYRHEQKAGDASGHIWAMDMDGFLSLFDGYTIEQSERIGASGLVVVRCV